MAEIRPTGFANCNFPAGTTWKTHTGYNLHFAVDGNLELISPRNDRVWESGTRNRGGAILSMQKDGDLVIYDAARRRVIWSAGTKGHPESFLSLQEDGNVVIYTSARKPIWSTGTSRK